MSDIIKNEAEQGSEPICSEPLTKQELDRLFWRYQLRYLTCCNLENWHGNCYAYDMAPLYKKYYDKEGQREGMLRMFDFINTEQTTASVLWGILVGMEEQKALGKPVNDEMIRTVKSSLMGPLAGVGDSLVQATILPLLTTIAISLTGAGDVLSPLGVVLFIIATPILLWAYARVLFNNGYTLGKDAVSTLMGTAMDRIKTAVQLFGIIVIGAVRVLREAVHAAFVRGFRRRNARGVAGRHQRHLPQPAEPASGHRLLVFALQEGHVRNQGDLRPYGHRRSARPHRDSLVERTTSGDKQSLRISRRAPVQVLRVGRP